MSDGDGKEKSETKPEAETDPGAGGTEDSADGKTKPSSSGNADAHESGSPADDDPAIEKAPEGDDDVPRLSMSDELKAALDEAEAHMNKRAKPTKAVSEEIEIDIDDEGEGPGGQGAETDKAEPKGFDPNRVEDVDTEGAPPPPTAKEIELKTEILDLRRKLREAEQEVEKKITEVKQNREQAQHIQKQLDGYKMRVQKEKADFFNYGHEPVFKEILAVVDNLERALEHAADDADAAAIKEGVELTLRQFKGILGKFGVVAVEPEGEQFNPEFHQAMMQVEDDNVAANTVVNVQQKGYLLKDRLLRPAMVAVSKSGKEKKQEPGQRSEDAEASAPGDEDAKKDGAAGAEAEDGNGQKESGDENN